MVSATGPAFPSKTLTAAAALTATLLVGVPDARQTAPSAPAGTAPIFVFDHPFWLNLHHFLYVLGRAEAKTSDAQRRAVADAPRDQEEGLKTLTDGEQRAWQAAVTFYAKGPSRNDVLFDGELVDFGRLHQWDDPIYAALSSEARRQGTVVPENLSHAMIFFTAGQAVRRISPGHIPTAESEGIWARSMGIFKRALENVWQPYLEGRGTRDEAIAGLIKSIPR